jgi:xanthine dehydrogenase accessory factor
MGWPSRIAQEIGRHGAVVRVTVARAEGSTPREAGAAMLVSRDAIEDTIGGGALEHQAIAHARAMLGRAADGPLWQRDVRPFALGPGLGQCCGGAVLLLFERFTQRERAALEDIARVAGQQGSAVLRPVGSGIAPEVLAPEVLAPEVAEGRFPPAVARVLRAWGQAGGSPRAMLVSGRKDEPDWYLEPLAAPTAPLVLHGAGHVGRALVRVLEGLPFGITWVDSRPGIFPAVIPAGVAVHRQQTDATPPMAVLPQNALHLVMTHSHPLDLEICHAVLRAGDFRFLGLIGSQTKRARFVKRLRELGIPAAQLERLVCPIGLPGIEGKQPAIVAVSIAAQLLQLVAQPGD